jgi:glycosyltransferase involved in cell wall biosynthesis
MINHNLPIISADVGDSTEIFGEGYDLLVINVEDADEYCQKIYEFYTRPDYYFNKITEIRKVIADKHSPDKFKDDYLNCIHSVSTRK